MRDRVRNDIRELIDRYDNGEHGVDVGKMLNGEVLAVVWLVGGETDGGGVTAVGTAEMRWEFVNLGPVCEEIPLGRFQSQAKLGKVEFTCSESSGKQLVIASRTLNIPCDALGSDNAKRSLPFRCGLAVVDDGQEQVVTLVRGARQYAKSDPVSLTVNFGARRDGMTKKRAVIKGSVLGAVKQAKYVGPILEEAYKAIQDEERQEEMRICVEQIQSQAAEDHRATETVLKEILVQHSEFASQTRADLESLVSVCQQGSEVVVEAKSSGTIEAKLVDIGDRYGAITATNIISTLEGMHQGKREMVIAALPGCRKAVATRLGASETAAEVCAWAESDDGPGLPYVAFIIDRVR